MISEPMVCLAQIVHLSCTDTNTISKRMKRASTWASSPRSTIGYVQYDFSVYGMFGANYGPILLRHKHYLQTYRNKIPFDPCHLRVPSGASKMVSQPMVRKAQTVQLSSISEWTNTNTVSKRSEMRFHMTHDT
jgi:hypothetical protein